MRIDGSHIKTQLWRIFKFWWRLFLIWIFLSITIKNAPKYFTYLREKGV